MMIAKIATIKNTTVKSLDPVKNPKKGVILLSSDDLPAAAKLTPKLKIACNFS